MSANINKYKQLKEKSLKTYEFSDRIKKGVSTIKERVTPRPVAENKQPDNSKKYEKLLNKLQSNYDKKLNSIQKQYASKLSGLENQNKDLYKALDATQKNTSKKFSDFRENISKLLRNINSQKQQQNKGDEEEQQQEQVAAADDGVYSSLRRFNTHTPTSIETDIDKKSGEVKEEAETAKEKEEEKADEVKETDEVDTQNEQLVESNLTKDAIKIDTKVPITTNFSYKITNMFGLRNGGNAVKDRSSTEHSGGVDIRLVDNQGNPIDLPMAVANGTITGVYLQGNGKAIPTSKGRAAGYYVDVKLDDTVAEDGSYKVARYMHLDPLVMEQKDKLIGKKISRGDIIVNGTRPTGSITGPHVKLSIYEVGPNGKPKTRIVERDGKKKVVIDYTLHDPTNLVLKGTLD